MTQEILKKFLDKVANDDALRAKLRSTPSPEAIVNAAKESGFAITIADVESSTATRELAGALSDADLDVVVGAGGRCIQTVKDDPNRPLSTTRTTCPPPNTYVKSPSCGGDDDEDDAPSTQGSGPGFF